MKGPDAIFREHLANGRFMLQRSRRSGIYIFYSRVLCATARSEELEWVEASGKGTVYSTTTIHRKPEQGGSFNVSLIALAEGPRVLSRVLGPRPEQIRIGMPVRAAIEKPAWSELAHEPVLVFRPSDHRVERADA